MLEIKTKLLLPLVVSLLLMLLGFIYVLSLHSQNRENFLALQEQSEESKLLSGLNYLKKDIMKVGFSLVNDWRLSDAIIMENRDALVDLIYPVHKTFNYDFVAVYNEEANVLGLGHLPSSFGKQDQFADEVKNTLEGQSFVKVLPYRQGYLLMAFNYMSPYEHGVKSVIAVGIELNQEKLKNAGIIDQNAEFEIYNIDTPKKVVSEKISSENANPVVRSVFIKIDDDFHAGPDYLVRLTLPQSELEDIQIDIVFISIFAFIAFLAVLYTHNVSKQAVKKQSKNYQSNQKILQQKVEERTRELYKAKTAAEQANVAKSQFLANMSHELRTPMHAILNFATLGLKRVEDEKLERYLQNIRTSGIRLTSLLNDLLDLSKLESGKVSVEFVDQDVTTLVIDAISELGSLLEQKSITIELNSEQSHECCIDQKLMSQVFVNLFSNAIKFSPENSMIQVNIERYEGVLNEQQQDILGISIEDTGPGIPAEQLETIFEKFIQSSQTTSYAGGTGLGLPITREIIGLHHGKIWAESPGLGRTVGSVFHIQIPVSQQLENDI